MEPGIWNLDLKYLIIISENGDLSLLEHPFLSLRRLLITLCQNLVYKLLVSQRLVETFDFPLL